eukprot:CAMPEP_0171094748 /NCGR_PEP_ID=MMETSP0766_2-20121228/42260_1 /TAXON_ID=439317 /ORGANISM="Gambierdiscus australes, Strain CAWD 149" /LENGTH=293 /DNA_ID=CAMNT_0011553455 /DNA_START=47 /DNA_END=929 /DNA_ORIENTATION=-
MGRLGTTAAVLAVGFANGLRVAKREDASISIQLSGEPKSGTRWIMNVVKEVFAEGCSELEQCSLSDDQLTVTMPTHEISFVWAGKHCIPNIGHTNGFDPSWPPAKSDAELADAAQATLRNSPEGRKWLVMLRDPRAVVISMCFHNTCHHLNEFVSSNTRRISKWIDLRHRYFSVLRSLAPERVFMVYYERMRGDELGTIKRVSQFVGMNLSSHQVKTVSNHTTFDNLKHHHDPNAVPGWLARKGLACGYKEELHEDVAKQVTQQMREALSPELNAGGPAEESAVDAGDRLSSV